MLRWIAPSVVGACAGALVAGVLEGVNAYFLERFLATTGLVCMLALPALLLASGAVRGLVAAWMPHTLLDGFREERGGMPRFAAWVGVVWLGTLALAWAMFQGTWMLASVTAFKPNSIGFLAPILAVVSVLVVVALSRPCADLFTRIARAIDRRWQRFAPGTLLHPRIIVGGAIVTALVGGYLIWALLVSRRFTHLDSGFLLGPLAGVLVVVAVHAAWTVGGARARLVRAIASGLVGAAAIAAIATAWVTVRGRADIALAIWAEEPIGGLAVERVFDLEAIRGDLPLDAFRPMAKVPFHHDLVVITFEGVRADRTPPYDGPAAMPALAALAERGTVFRWAFAPSHVAPRAIPSMITGYGPQRVRGKPHGDALQLDPRHVVLAERLRAAGYETAAFTCCAEYWSADARTGWARGLEHVTIDDDNVRLGQAARTWLAARTSTKPLFVWVHVRPTADRERERVGDAARRTAYDRSLASVDGVLAQVVAAFGARRADASPIFVVTSARGEELGEHGAFRSRGDDLYNTQIRVPFVIAGPGVMKQVFQENVSLTDLMPTVIDLGGYHPPRGIDGRSLADVAFGGRRSEGTNVAYAAIISERGTPKSSTVVRGGWKLIDTGASLELYDLRADPDEKTNLAGQRTQAVSEMRKLLNARTKAGKTAPF